MNLREVFRLYDRRKIVEEFLKEIDIGSIIFEIKKEMERSGIDTTKIDFPKNKIKIGYDWWMKLTGLRGQSGVFGVLMSSRDLIGFKSKTQKDKDSVISTLIHELCHYYTNFGIQTSPWSNVLLNEAVTMILEERVSTKVIGRENYSYAGMVYYGYRAIFGMVTVILSHNLNVSRTDIENGFIYSYFNRTFGTDFSQKYKDILDREFGDGFTAKLLNIKAGRQKLLELIMQYPKILPVEHFGEYLVELNMSKER